MRVCYMIHRGRRSFLQEKTLFRCIADYYGKEYPGLQFINQGIKFSIKYKDVLVDFEYGYHHMHRRDFSRYSYIISTGLFAVFAKAIRPGDLLFTKSTREMSLGKKQVIFKEAEVSYENPMETVYGHVRGFERDVDVKGMKDCIRKNLGVASKKTLKDLRVFRKGHLATANAIFMPSKLARHKWFEMRNNRKIPITDPRQYLEKNFDGLNIETYRMIGLKKKMLMFSVGLDKPYEIAELSAELRHEKNYQRILKTYDLALIHYFKFLLFGYLLSRRFRL